MLDADPQGNTTHWITPVAPGYNALAQALLPPHPLITSLLQPIAGEWNLALAPGGPDTGDALIYLTAARKPFQTISDALQPLRNAGLTVLIDMPPSRAAGFKELLYAADYILIPTQLERPSLTGVSLMHKTIQELTADYGHAPRLLGIVPNMAMYTVEHRQRLHELTQSFREHVWPPIPRSIVVAEANGFSETCFTYSKRAKVTLALITIGQRFIQNTDRLT